MLQLTDDVLVDRCRNGDREAFEEIVRRYQILVCSIAYATTGNRSSSEEIAQETFVSAWKSIDGLRDSGRLRAWLCGIARNQARNRCRSSDRDLVHQAAELGEMDVADKRDVDPAHATLAKEESDLVDQSLAGLPDKYREPLILFYREDQSVARVAELLELSSDAVKQRLARGRDMIRAELHEIVERGLLQSAPGRAFTVGVISALPIMTGSAKAATLAVTSAKGMNTMGATSWFGIAGAILGPIAGALGGYFGYSMSLKSARSERERTFVRKVAVIALIFAVVQMLGIAALVLFGDQILQQGAGSLAIAIVGVATFYIVGLLGLILWSNRGIVRIRKEDGTETSAASHELSGFMKEVQQPRHYDSPQRLLGLPLVSIRFSGSSGHGGRSSGTAKGWIAIGECAYGVLFASGPLAFGGIAVGAIAVGPIAIGGMALGVVAMAGFAIAAWAMGGAAIGWFAFGGLAVAYEAAAGGIAVAKHFALGGLAVGEHFNDEATKAFLNETAFFQICQTVLQPWSWLVVFMIAFLPSWLAIKRVRPVGTEEQLS